MAMGRRKDRGRTPALWVAADALPRTGGHPFYQRLNRELEAHGFDAFVESQCALFYAATVGRPSLLPGTYFRLLFIGYFEGVDSKRGIAWRAADSLALRGFLGLGLEEATPEHSTSSRIRRLIDLETHRTVLPGNRAGTSARRHRDFQSARRSRRTPSAQSAALAWNLRPAMRARRRVRRVPSTRTPA